jgi:molybdopterin-containing oxidoreductase family iron-sulfur binding subunit
VAATGPSAFELIFDRHWHKVLHDGLLHEGSSPTATTVKGDKIAAAIPAIKPAPGDGMEITFPPDAKLFDGRFANNGWLQELSDPITKLDWDNAALLSVRTAQALGVEKDDMVQVTVRGRTVDAAVFVQPGQADNTVTLALGYGRRNTGRVGTGAGFNAYLLRDSAALGFDVGATVKATGSKYHDPRDENFLDLIKITGLVTTQDHTSTVARLKGLVSTQDHHAVEGRPLAREASLSEFRKEPDFAKHEVHLPELKSLWDGPSYMVPQIGKPAVGFTGQQWGLAIDLSACVGCNACAIACQAENNIPIVGKAQVRKGREMAWIRVDRYFSGDTDNPEAIQQPVTCMQCENAPCENVCPVGATVHSGDGLNDMVYNRCVGTRYCANNCPYKVRRFNYLDFRGDVTEIAKLMYNPDVTLRSRGVMEKCTYCVQRIRGAQRDAKLHGEDRVTDGVITPACAQACPAEAIVFGDITDPNSRVSLVKKSQRNYEMLAELNVKPRTSYLARIRNLNPELSSHE